MTTPPTPEHRRVRDSVDASGDWKRWGAYVSDRAWATVREDYSADGDAWSFLPHDLARSKAYRWGEDGIAAFCDRYQLLCLAPAFWNGKDPILKERFFGLTAHEGNHGEDVKEYYFYLDATPTHSYLKFLYKYPQAEFPYDLLVEENRRRNGEGFEFELLDTGIFDEDRYFDIFVEYAKASPEDICVRIEAINRGPDTAPLHIIPQLWFRNTWSWGEAAKARHPFPEPSITLGPTGPGFLSLLSCDCAVRALAEVPVDYTLGARALYAPSGADVLFTFNETNGPRVFGADAVSHRPYVKDAFHRSIIHGERVTNPVALGTKAALHYAFEAVPPGSSVVVRLRLTNDQKLANPLDRVDEVIALRKAQADAFYDAIHPPDASEDERRVQRQAFAGLLWSKMFYFFDVRAWLDGDDPALPPPAARKAIRNEHWRHINSLRVLVPAEKWEYPWFAAWDLAFTCVPLALVDAPFAKKQLQLLLREQFQHPNGQLPAYEWEFSDLNPPVHAWAVWRVYNMDRIRSGEADRDFLERSFHKLLMNFAWWVNKVDHRGNNIFEGGFLGMDNIAVVDRSTRCDDGSVLEQSDGSGYMGMFCLNMMRIALELAKENHTYETLAIKFFVHYAYIARAMKRMGGRDYALWDRQDGFFYDVLTYPDGRFRTFRVRSLVGLVPVFAVERLEVEWIKPFTDFTKVFYWVLQHRPDLVHDVVHEVGEGAQKTYALTILDAGQLTRIMRRVFDETEFLSPYGLRSLSRAHKDAPFVFDGRSVGYEPAESVSKIKGGNSNWRGPVWFPTAFLFIEALRKLGKAFGQDFQVDVPASPGKPMTFPQMARELAERLMRIFRRGPDGRRPVYGGTQKFQADPYWRDLLLYYEYFHGDNGAGLGAGHQTGWTGLVASLIDEWRR